MTSLSTEMALSSAAGIVAAREKCSRNKRKFRQDPPFPSSQGSGDENNICGGGNINAGVLSEGESNWMPDSTTARSVEVLTSSKGCSSCISTDSSPSRKGSDGGGTTTSHSNSVTNNSKSEIATSNRSFHQDQVKLMRFRSGQATRAGKLFGGTAAGWNGKQLPEESSIGVDRHDNHNGNKALEEGFNEFYELGEEEWDDAESELEDLLVKNLGSIYDEAINRIIASGHSAEEALGAVLKHGLCYGSKDPVSNIVENSLACLVGKKQPYTAAATPSTDDNGTSSPGDHRIFSDLTELHKYSLAQMVGLLREVRPSLSKGDAMWCLLMSDMNVPLACVMDDSALSPPLLNKEQQQPCPGGPPLTNNHSSSEQAGPRVVGLPTTTSPPPPNCDSKSTVPTSSTTLNSSDSPACSMQSPSTASAVFNSPTPAPAKAPTSPPRNPSSLSSPPDSSLLSLLDSIPHSSTVSSRGLKSDETSSNFEELLASEEGGTPQMAGGFDCASSEVGDEDVADEQEQDARIAGLTSSAGMPGKASLKLDEKVDQEQLRSTMESDKNGNIMQHSSIKIREPPREPSLQVKDDDVLKEIIKREDNLDISESKQRTPSEPEALQVAELRLATSDGVVSSPDKHSGNSFVSPPQPLNSQTTTTGIISTQENSSSFSLRVPQATCLVAERPKEATSSPPAVKFGTFDESGPANAVAATATTMSSSNSPPAECDGYSTTTSTVDGTVISHKTLHASLQAAENTDAALEERVAKDTTTITFVSSPEAAPAECFGSSNETTTSVLVKGQVEDQKDEMIMKLVYRSKELETQLQERTEWAKQKVMQAARKLSNDLQELKELRRERDEAQRLKKDKQASEDSTMKKLSDSENALRKAKGQLDEANKSVKKLDAENAEIRAEMQAAKLSAAEAQSACQEMANREKKNIKRVQAWEKQKAQMQEALSEEKRKIVALQQQLILAKERQQQAEVRWRQEEKAKEDAVLRADHERRGKEQAEAAAKKREESLRRKAESNYQRHREDIQRLESEISQFRTSAEAAQLATSRWGPGVAVTPHMMELSSLQALKESNSRLAREIAELQDMARREVHRERECVMCMCEEMSVVFLPCAHQVVCVKCNDLHEKQGMRDCPSCRTPIKQRIRVYGVST
ncbi:unnamed protein product [Calypogeia fissa]